MNGGNSKKNGNSLINVTENRVECIGQLIITSSKTKAILTFHPDCKKSDQYFTKQVDSN